MNGNEKPLTPEGIIARAVSADGKNLIAADRDLTQFQLFPVDGGPARPLPQLQKGDAPQDFTSDDKAILLRRSGKDGAIEIWRLELATGKRTLLRSLSAPGARAVARGRTVGLLPRRKKLRLHLPAGDLHGVPGSRNSLEIKNNDKERIPYTSTNIAASESP